ncbi:MarR family transcriptional regulator [Pedobacter sp. ISL-68]|jgi:DNA-binding MarR family transcriptional regulator|uniref:MarR family transcriptional regulator n=1 Tax=Pedobacter kyonggii TaxID=1926871 RepID=A0A4Q9HAL9_9SPHI|nr:MULTISPECIES: MarR family transcriptional regulator [Pedobacter]MDQ0966319.1 DNA-binding MarR family transcriptional regulator [Flavobacterium sp. W4I14]MBT2561588.1 MarR family transcriptional regulator [Pedobacter sp. ISL-64]MBT2590977.1 MarR family transcriptional regulator [Pedobacter sp. ISL-68]TBO41087.1 MarR family transcriptional regulator [Pedobacter kyonggii]CAH0129839.1 putative HTH-type transcriptional regulator Rv0880 [Pedobacter sp. Bi36]
MPTQTQDIAAKLRSTVTRLTRQLRKQNVSSDFSNAELLTMSLLEQHGKMLSTELADMERVSKQAISQIINRLFDAKCVERFPSKEDKRKVFIGLTKLGEKHIIASRKIKEEWLAQTMEKIFSSEEINLIQAFLPLLSRLVEHNGARV